MEIFSQLLEMFSKLDTVKDWEELKAVFQRAAQAKPRHWLLPALTGEAVGGTERQAFPAMLAIACGHIGIILNDDMLDNDPRGVHVDAGMAGTANIASALQGAAGLVIAQSSMDRSVKLRASEAVNAMFLATALGQHWDVNTIIRDEEAYWKIARAKSAPFFSTAFEIGALTGGVSLEMAAQIKELGAIYGEMIQIHDDLDDTLAVPAKPDWDTGRVSLPILFAQVVDHPSRSRFEELRPHACEQVSALEEAQQILIECGAVSYCIHELLERYDRAREMISKMNLAGRNGLEKIFEDVTQPVFHLLEEMDEVPPHS